MVEAEEVSQTQHIIYVLFVVVLSITGIYIAFSFLSGASVAFTFHDYASRLNILSSKLLLSPECFAVADSYELTKDGKKYSGRQVSAGIIDFSRIPSDNILPEKCVRGENASWLQLTDLEDNAVKKLWSCTEYACQGEGRGITCKYLESQARCEDYAAEGCRWGIVPCQEPGFDGWKKESRSFFVLIKKGNEFHKGVLTVRLKG